jgi:alanine-synthesizing transaminase
VRTVSYPLLREEAFRIDTAGVRARIGERTRAIVMVAPNNPTGSLVHEEDARLLDEIAHEHGLALIVDEVFADYLLESPAPALRATFAGVATASTCFVLSGLSKVLLSPQLKLGWVLVGGPESDEIMERLSIIADTFLSVSSPAQLALPALLQARPQIQSELRARIANNMETLARLTADPSCPARARRPTGGWSALVEVPRVMSEDAWVRSLVTKAGVRVQPGWFYDVEDGGTLVLSLIVEPARFELGVEKLCELVARHS